MLLSTVFFLHFANTMPSWFNEIRLFFYLLRNLLFSVSIGTQLDYFFSFWTIFRVHLKSLQTLACLFCPSSHSHILYKWGRGEGKNRNFKALQKASRIVTIQTSGEVEIHRKGFMREKECLLSLTQTCFLTRSLKLDLIA